MNKLREIAEYLKCNTCNGTGKITETKYELDSIGQALFPNRGERYCGYSDELSRQRREEHTHKVAYEKTCSNCGGSGLKYKEFEKGVNSEHCGFLWHLKDRTGVSYEQY